jgi:CheY-like chemotaxis protein
MALSPLRILVVDDHPDTLETMLVLLSAHGREVRAARTGADALSVAEDFRPDVVLLDIGMPGMDGYEVARRLRAVPELVDLQIIAVTGHGMPLDMVCSREAGFDEHLVKPIDPARLESLLAGPLGRA